MPYASDTTFKLMRTLIDPTCFPPAASDTVKNTLINKVRFMFYNSPEGQIWRGTEGVVAIAVVTQPDGTQTITMPRGWQTILGVYDSGDIINLENEWYIYLQEPLCAIFLPKLLDMGDGFVGVANLPSAGAKMQIQTTATEAGSLTVQFYGTDANGNPLNEVVNVPTTSGNTAQTTNTFYSVTQVVKSITAGDVIASIVGSPNVFFCRYQAGEQSPNYRRYQFTFTESDATVTTRSKRKYVDLVADNDPCDIANVIAMENGLRAYRFYQNTDLVKAQGCLAEAFKFLNGELSRDESDSQLGSVAIDYDTGGGSIPNIL